ncbi:MAG: T9SS type A sorting domain-containing protein [Bacteroidetes bacterium]|nr:T9SS type A sorting domain-containing protein [Bacteroidota bacterium]MBS1940313.1 T9SS type A sorting domain-containing protein [Bacteroidota bacterium]
MGSLIAGHPERMQEIAQARAQLEHFTSTWQADAARGGGAYVIPVVFHIIHNNGPENISDDQVRDAVRVMNEDYNKLNPEWPDVQPEFLGIVADVGITFKLAQLDPSGNCTNGITRTVSTLTYDGDQNMKNLIQWPRNRYLNVWVSAGAGGAAGYSMYPSAVSGSWGAPADGIVILSDYVGSIGTSSVSHSHALSHEAGHWLNLKHCWGDSNTPGLASNCGEDDNVSDTPNTIGWTTCNLRGATCGSAVDNVENFMEYSYCSKMFTNGQKARLLAALNSSTASRNNLWTASNLALTGCSGPDQLCMADMSADKRVICAGGSINFSDESYNGVTTWNWNFPGGTPSASTIQDPVITYDVPGTYDVNLTAGNGSSTVNAQRPQYIVVLPNTGLPLPLAEGFEATASLPSADWMVNDINQDGTFQAVGNAAYSGSKSVRLLNTAAKSGNVDELISNTIDLSTSGPTTISFRYAFAKRTANNTDALRLYISKDCGQTWVLKRALTGTSLSTASVQGGSFTPNGPDQWGYSETSPVTGDYLTSNLRLKFWFQSGGGNNLWLDDININGAPLGIADAAGSSTAVNVVPNPAGDRAEVFANLKDAGPVRVEVLDLLGQPVMHVASGVKPAGPAQWALNLESLPTGLYLVRVQQQDAVQVVRFTKN